MQIAEKKCPLVRFKGFTDDWEQRKYNDVIHLLSGQDFAPTEYNDLGKGIPYMTGASCIDGNGTFVNRWTPTPRCIAEKGDVLIVCKGSGCGTIAVLVQDRAHIARQFMALKSLPSLDTTFNFYLANSVVKNIKKDARGLIAGIARDAVLQQGITIPKLMEQEKIGVFFKSLDNLITLHQCKLDQLTAFKKAMLGKMFLQEGARVPEVRFSGFTDDWEQRKLGEITVKIGSGKTPHGGDAAYKDKGIPLIRSQNVFDDKVDMSDVVYIDIATDGEMQNSRVHTGDVLLNITGASIGRSAVYKRKCQANVNQHVCIIRPEREFCSDFIQIQLSSQYGQNQIDRNQAGGAREGLNFQQIGKMIFYFPILDEQKKLGEFFFHIDNLITLHQHKLTSLQQAKKSLLQKMFI